MRSIKQRFLADKTTKSEINEKPKGKSSRQKPQENALSQKSLTQKFSYIPFNLSFFTFRHPKKVHNMFFYISTDTFLNIHKLYSKHFH